MRVLSLTSEFNRIYEAEFPWEADNGSSAKEFLAYYGVGNITISIVFVATATGS
jgi:hypothetical protein